MAWSPAGLVARREGEADGKVGWRLCNTVVEWRHGCTVAHQVSLGHGCGTV